MFMGFPEEWASNSFVISIDMSSKCLEIRPKLLMAISIVSHWLSTDSDSNPFHWGGHRRRRRGTRGRPQNLGKIFSSKNHVKFGHFVNVFFGNISCKIRAFC